MIIDYTKSFELFQESGLNDWVPLLEKQVEAAFSGGRWGDLPTWFDTIEHLPDIMPSLIKLDADIVTIGTGDDCDGATRKKVEELLLRLHPWRKGPFKLFDIFVDTEWRSDIKWNRLKGIISPLKGKKILDVGCASGYHCYRMLGEGAELVVGIDPIMLYVMQFYAFQRYIRDPRASVFPIGIDDLPENLEAFDAVFSMGLMYHRRSPLDHLLQLKSFLKEGGELVLETLVIDGELGQVLNPQGRYAKMPNVWFIPSVPTLESWLVRMGFCNVRAVDAAKTTTEEQRVTKWMGFESLANFLDPDDPEKTIEGYPAPKRAVFLANK